MNVVVIGKGGREHALAWKIAQSPLVSRVYVAPGNAGTELDPNLESVAVDVSDTDGLVTMAKSRNASLVVVGPEAPLVDGLADRLREAGLLVVGPGADGAELEGSKSFAKAMMSDANVPTARGALVRTPDEVDQFVDGFDGDALVVKADGLAGGKGVIVCSDNEQARAEAKRMLAEQPFGEASKAVVLEERLTGVETSYIVLTDGESFAALPTSQDHKRLLDGGIGPNTGGMGAYSPAPFVTDELATTIEDKIIRPMLRQLKREAIDFRGFLYAGLMLTKSGPRVLEFNVRLGDPETQALVRAIPIDIVPALLGCAKGKLGVLDFGPTQPSAVVVVASDGYPAKPKIGAEISGVDEANDLDDVVVFHAGTALVDQKLLTTGGRVLGVTATGATPEDAVKRAYTGIDVVCFDGMQLRRDIGASLSDE